MPFYLFFIGLLIYAQSVFAGKTSSDTLPEVVVQASLEPSLTVLSLKGAEDAIYRTPGGVSVVDSEDYKKGRSSTLQDVLGYTAGVYIQPRFGAEESRLSIRGSGIQRTFHLRGIKILQDGIPINQADGGGDFQSIDPLSLRYVEVFRGANALRYGATTLGGAINFVTPTGHDASLFQSRFEIGSFNYLREQVSSGAVIGPADYYVSLSELRQDGFRNHSDQWNQRLFSNVGFRLTDQLETRFYISAVDSKSQLPGSLSRGQMKQNPKQNNPANVTGNQKRDFDLVQLGNKTALKWEEQTFEVAGFYVRKDLFHPIFQVIDQISNDLGASFRYLNGKNLFNRRNLFTLGFNPVWGITDDLRHTNVGGDRGARMAESRQHSYNLDLYAEEQFYAFEKLALIGGGQWSFASRKTRDKFLADGNHSGHPTYIGVSPKAGLRYDVTERSQVFANFSRSFEPPSFGELTNRLGGGVLNLKEQTASTIEVGTRGEFSRVSWDFAYYYSWVQNELLSLNDGSGNPLGTLNADKTRHQGVELGAGVSLFEGMLKRNLEEEKDKIFLRGIYNWSFFNFSNDPVYSDNPLPGIPEHFVRLELAYEHPCGIYFGPNTELASKFAVDMNRTLFTYPYALLGLKGGYRTKKGISLFVEARNLTNEIYAATTGVIADARGIDSAQFLPGDGRSITSGVELRW